MKENNPFTRQLAIDCWSQDKIQNQCALLLGIGGLGTWVAQSLCRLGIGKVILLDYDNVQISNLNRQILYSRSDLGKVKAEQAALHLQQLHCVGQHTKVEWRSYCALKNWSKVVTLAKESTVVFNMIDYGDHFDAAVQSLCLKLNLPLFLGGTFNQSLSLDIFIPDNNTPCYGCISDNLKPQMLDKISQDKIMDLDDISFLPKDDHPEGVSNAYLAATAANLLVAQFSSYLLADPEVKLKQRVICTVNACEMFGFADIQRDRSCSLCGFVYVPPPPKEEQKKEEGGENKEEGDQTKEKITEKANSGESTEEKKNEEDSGSKQDGTCKEALQIDKQQQDQTELDKQDQQQEKSEKIDGQ